MQIEEIKVYNVLHAIKGMRAPFKAYSEVDTEVQGDEVKIGEKDLKRALALASKTPEHRKFLRQIIVAMEITAPRYWWSEFDTYHYAEKNSESTMHTIMKRPILLTDFSPLQYSGHRAEFASYVATLNYIRESYLQSKDDDVLEELKRMLPEGYLQKRFITTNFECLLNIYRQRRSHRLREWRDFCNIMIENVPYFSTFVG